MGNEQPKSERLQVGSETTRRSSAHDCPISVQLLSGKEKKMVRQYWAKNKSQHPDFFTLVWENVLERSGNMCRIIGVEPGQTREQRQENQRFVAATTGIAEFFETLIVRFDLSHEKLCAASLEMGARHADFYPQGFQAIYWDIFAVALVEEFEKLKDAETGGRDAIYAWQKLVHLVVTQMVEGYRDARREPDLDPTAHPD